MLNKIANGAGSGGAMHLDSKLLIASAAVLFVAAAVMLFFAIAPVGGPGAAKSTTMSTTIPAANATLDGDELSFSGRTWEIEKSSEITQPGDNYFYYNASSDYVDANGYLHMSLLNVNGSRYASEVDLEESLGYGTYTFVVQGDLRNLDRNAVFGLFTWDNSGNDTPGNQYNREIDMEISRWGNASDVYNAQVGVQPETGDAIANYTIGYAGDIEESMHWKAGEVDILIREADAPYETIERWNYTGPFVPTPGLEKMAINLWAFGAPTESNVTVVVQRFNFSRN